MYAEQDLVFSYWQGLGLNFKVEEYTTDNQSLKQEEEFFHQFEESGDVNDTTFFNSDYYAHNHIPLVCSPGHNVARTPSISAYYLGGEGDMFKAPEPIMEELMDIFDMKAIEVMETDHLLNDLLEESAIEETFPELAEVEFPLLDMNIDKAGNGGVSVLEDGAMQISCMTSKVRTSTGGGGPVRPRRLDFKEVDLEADCSLRRANSEGDIKMEERSAKLSRYRKKKMTRNFERKIKYACRKALADNQPRIRGRFARTDEFSSAK